MLSQAEADAILIIDSDAMLSVSIMAKRLEAMNRGHTKVVEGFRSVKLVEFSLGDASKVLG